MNINTIGSTISSIPSSAKSVADSIGTATTNNLNKAGSYVQGKTADVSKMKQPEFVDKFVKSANDHTPDVVKNNKKTILGAAVILAAVGSAVAIVKSIVGKIKEAKNANLYKIDGARIGMHQG